MTAAETPRTPDSIEQIRTQLEDEKAAHLKTHADLEAQQAITADLRQEIENQRAELERLRPLVGSRTVLDPAAMNVPLEPWTPPR